MQDAGVQVGLDYCGEDGGCVDEGGEGGREEGRCFVVEGVAGWTEGVG